MGISINIISQTNLSFNLYLMSIKLMENFLRSSGKLHSKLHESKILEGVGTYLRIFSNRRRGEYKLWKFSIT